MSSLKFMLAKITFKENMITGWYMSEKFDGYRACYVLKTNTSIHDKTNPLMSGMVFTSDASTIDGWGAVDWTESLSRDGAVRKKVPLDEEWLNITFQVYDMPRTSWTLFRQNQKEYKNGEVGPSQVEPKTN